MYILFIQTHCSCLMDAKTSGGADKHQISVYVRWRIQDFPDRWSANPPKVGAPTYYFAQFFPKNA